MIPIEGYIEEEKLHIAKRHLIPRQMKRHGLADLELVMPDSILQEIISSYTKEAGVRQLERTLASIFRKFAKEIVIEREEVSKKSSKKENSKVSKTLKLTSKHELEKMLGNRKFRFTELENASMVGLTNGLAWTETGGETLAVETLVIPGIGKYTLTGQLGDVMKESCSASLSFVRSLSSLFNLDKKYFKNHDFHIHVPEGAIPKDGPSAGVAIITSLVSAILRIPVKHDVAMTGEITLRGRVLPIGGFKREDSCSSSRENQNSDYP